MDKNSLDKFYEILTDDLPRFISRGDKTTSPGSFKRSRNIHYNFDNDDTEKRISLWSSSNQSKKISNLSKQVQTQYGEVINPNAISMNNQKTLELFQNGDITGVYQNSSEDEWAKEYLVEFRPDSFYDLVIISPFFHYGMSERYATLLQRKKGGKRRFSPLIKNLFTNLNDLSAEAPIMNKENEHLFECDDLLFDTYGLIIFQEQTMRLAQLIADFTPEESNNLRKALGKKQKLKEYEKEFLERGQAKGHPLAGLKSLWKEWEENGPYYYSKGSAVANTIELFQIAYFKAHYRKAFDEVNKKIW